MLSIYMIVIQGLAKTGDNQKFKITPMVKHIQTTSSPEPLTDLSDILHEAYGALSYIN